MTEAHPSDRNILSPKTSMTAKPPAALPSEVSQQLPSAWGSQDTHQDLSQPSSLNTSDFAQDNIYEVCGERSGPVEITVQGSPVQIPTTLSMDSSTSGGYGSIPHLDASPRRYRYIDSDSDSLFHRDSPSSTLSIPVAARLVGLSHGGQHEVSDSPPKLPERAPKTLNSGAPPPLPPKKPLSNQNSKTSIKNVSMNSNVALMAACFAESSRMGASDDIYDFPPEPMIGNVNLNQEEAKQCITDILKTSKTVSKPGPVMPDLGSVTIEELSRMSVMELNEKMTAGLIPEELKGMSIFELVDFVAKQMNMKIKKMQEEEEEDKASIPEMCNYPAQVHQPNVAPTSMKPSFSDNFIAEKLAPPVQKPEQPVSVSVPAAQPQLSNLDIIAGLARKSPLTNMNSNVSSNTDEMSKCFDDDFAHFQLPTSSISGRESSVSEQDKEPIYDKYAVFRELQMEEDLLRGWKTPSEEEKEKQGNDQDQDDNEDKSDDNDDNDDDDDEDEEDERDEKQIDLIGGRDEDSQERPICSSEGSPRSRSRSDTGSIQKSVSEDGTLDDLKIGSEVGSHDRRDHDPKRESQIPIFFVEEGNADADADVDDASDDENDKRNAGNGEAATKLDQNEVVLNDSVNNVDVDDKANEFEANFEAALGCQAAADPVRASHPDSNKFEHNFDEAFGPAGDLTVTKDWTTFEDDSGQQQFAEAANDLQEHEQQQQLLQQQQQQQQQQQYLDLVGDNDQHFSMGSFTLTEDEQQREVEFERLKQEELRQQQSLFEEQKRLQAELQHQYALQKELQFHRQVQPCYN